MTQLVDLIAGKAHDVIFQHDSARIVQTCLQFGSPEQRDVLFAELLPHTVELAKSKYAKFIVAKMLEYGAKAQKAAVLAKFHGHVRKLVKHTYAAPVLALAYADFASPAEKMDLMQELYGPEFAVFKVGPARSCSCFCLFLSLPLSPRERDDLEKRKFFFPQLIDNADFGCPPSRWGVRPIAR